MAAGRVPVLTRREQEVLDHVARGRENKEIARDLGVDESTVKKHVYNIFLALEVRNRVEAAVYYVTDQPLVVCERVPKGARERYLPDRTAPRQRWIHGNRAS